MIRDRFVPVILDGYLKGTAAEREFLNRVGLVGNGFTYLTAGGRKLGGDSYLGPNDMAKALDEFSRLPEAERRTAAVLTAPAPGPGKNARDQDGVPLEPPPGCLIASVYFTYLEDDGNGGYRRALWHVEGQPGTQPGSGHGRNQIVTHIDKFWLTREEWRSLLPSRATPGHTYPLPPAIHQRIVRFYANDMAHRSTGDKVRGAELTLTVESASADGVALRLSGFTRTGRPFELSPDRDEGGSEAPGLCGADFRFLGHLHYDAKLDAFDRFDIVALGEGWGGDAKRAATTNFYRGGSHRRWPMGIAFQLLTTRRPIDRIPPQNANPYRCGEAYFKTEKSGD